MSAAAIVVERVVEWADTDASGHHYNGAVLRWVEAAEAALLESLDLAWLWGRIPRVHYEVSYRERLWFGQEITVELGVGHVGRTSLRYAFTVRRDDAVAAQGTVTAVHAEPDAPAAAPWPEAVRAVLSGGRATGQD